MPKCKKDGRGKTTIHGMYGTRPYKIWQQLKSRCDHCYPQSKGSKSYKTKGIIYTQKWKTFIGFWKDMEKGYSKKLTLDRIDNDGNYCKENCRWTTQITQNNNRSNSISYNGETASEACKRIGGNNIIYGRLKDGWTKEKAFNTPLRKYKYASL